MLGQEAPRVDRHGRPGRAPGPSAALGDALQLRAGERGVGDAAAGLLRAGETEGWLRLYKKGGKRHDVPAHHRAAAALDAYIEAGKTHAARLRPRLEPPRPQPRPIWSTVQDLSARGVGCGCSLATGRRSTSPAPRLVTRRYPSPPGWRRTLDGTVVLERVVADAHLANTALLRGDGDNLHTCVQVHKRRPPLGAAATLRDPSRCSKGMSGFDPRSVRNTASSSSAEAIGPASTSNAPATSAAMRRTTTPASSTVFRCSTLLATMSNPRYRGPSRIRRTASPTIQDFPRCRGAQTVM